MSGITLISVPKLHPERIPALYKALSEALPLVIPRDADGNILEDKGAHKDVKPLFQEFHDSAQAISEAVARGLSGDFRDLDTDHDDPGYALHSSLKNVIRGTNARKLPLSSDHEKDRKDAFMLLSFLFGKRGTAIFRLGYLAQWSAVDTFLARARSSAAKEALVRLGLWRFIERLTDAHEAMAVAIGLKSPGGDPNQSTIARFERAARKLLGAVSLHYGEETPEDQKWRQILLGAYEAQVAAFRAEQRRRPEDEEEEEGESVEEEIAEDEVVDDL